jgi:ABC-type uncharacterized transport system ATPase subunit
VVEVRVTVRNFRAVDEVEVDFRLGDINVLYGPSGGGKSTIIHAMLALMGEIERVEPVRLAGETEISISYGASRVGYAGGRFYCEHEGVRVEGERKTEIMQCIEGFWADVGVRRVGVVRGDTVTVYHIPSFREALRLNVWDQESWEALTRDPWVYGAVKEHAVPLTLVFHMVSGYALKDNRWVRAVELGYGERRAIAMLLATYYSDMLVVEGFDNGLHVDLAVGLLKELREMGRTVVVETHIGLIPAVSVKRGWNLYYISNGRAERVTRETIASSRLPEEEAKVYQEVMA